MSPPGSGDFEKCWQLGIRMSRDVFQCEIIGRKRVGENTDGNACKNTEAIT